MPPPTRGGLERVARDLVRLPQRHVQPASVRPARAQRFLRGWHLGAAAGPGDRPAARSSRLASGRRTVRIPDGDGGWTRGGEGTVPYRSRRPRTRTAALPDLLHAVPRRARRRPGHDRQARLLAAPLVPRRSPPRRARRPLLQRHHQRLRRDVLVRLARPGRRPLGDRGLHPALQLSQNARLEDVPAAELAKLEGKER